jgi:hypothetical protein
MMPTCRQVSRLIAAGDVESLPFHRRLWVTLHVSMCGRCARFTRELRRIGEAARARWALGTEDRETVDRLEQVVLRQLSQDVDRRGDSPA